MSVSEAKTRLDALRGQITNHNTNIKKYTKEKTEVLKILGEINGLIEEIKSTKGINNKAKEDLDVLIRLVDGLPQIDQELKDDELVDVLGILKDVKNNLEGIGGAGPGGAGPGGAGPGGAGPSGDSHGVQVGEVLNGWRKTATGWEPVNSRGGRKRGGFKFTSNAIKSRKSRFMTRKRKSKSPKRRKKRRQKRTRRKRKRKGRKSKRKSRRKRRRR